MRHLRHTLAALLVLILGSSPALAYELPKPQLIAVYFAADWCPNCKVLSPILAEARRKGDLENQAVLFVKLDLTNEATIHQSVMLAQALGIAPFVQAQGSATGYVALLSADKKQEVARFDRASTADSIIATIIKQLPAAKK